MNYQTRKHLADFPPGPSHTDNQITVAYFKLTKKKKSSEQNCHLVYLNHTSVCKRLFFFRVGPQCFTLVLKYIIKFSIGSFLLFKTKQSKRKQTKSKKNISLKCGFYNIKSKSCVFYLSFFLLSFLSLLFFPERGGVLHIIKFNCQLKVKLQILWNTDFVC